jgi:hypothetical protein
LTPSRKTLGRPPASALAAVVVALVAGIALNALPHGSPLDGRARAQTLSEPPLVATPRADCGPSSRPEPSIQGRVPREEVDSGRATNGYWCNLAVVGQSGSTGGFRVHRYVDEQGHECAYYDTTLLFPTNVLSLSAEPTGVAVLDMSDPSNPVRTDTLLTPAMQTPHESLNISVERGVLAAVTGNPTQYPGGVDVYDISNDCRHPQPKAAAFPASPWGHESGMAPDGLTFYPSSPGGPFGLSAVDISNQQLPQTLVTSELDTHGMGVSEDGRRGYHAISDGLAITDLSEVQDREPTPQINEISRLTWSNVTIPQYAAPITIGGKPYLFEVDEFSTGEDGQLTGNGPRVGAARIIDISDETAPRVVSNIRLEVHQPEHRDEIADDYGAQSPVQGYAGHYCNVPRTQEPGIIACSMIASGLRVFDIRDPENPKEIAYFIAPPSTVSGTGGPTIDERANWAMAEPAFAPERREIWYSDGTSGFYALRLTDAVWPGAGEVKGAGACAALKRGTRRRDRIVGSELGERIVGRRGPDKLKGGPGDDCVLGNKGNDRIAGNPGADRLSGQKGGDRLKGGGGDDVIKGGNGNDLIKARDGDPDLVRCGTGSGDRAKIDEIDRARGCEMISSR